MEYLPSPANALPGIDIPLLEVLPIAARSTSAHDRHRQNTAAPGHLFTASWGEVFWLPIYKHKNRTARKDNSDHVVAGPSDGRHHIARDDDGNEFAGGEDDSDDSLQYHIESTNPARHGPRITLDQWRSFASHNRIFDPDEPSKVLLAQPVERLAALLQSWAFFGLIELSLARCSPISPRDWARRLKPDGTFAKREYKRAKAKRAITWYQAINSLPGNAMVQQPHNHSKNAIRHSWDMWTRRMLPLHDFYAVKWPSEFLGSLHAQNMRWLPFVFRAAADVMAVCEQLEVSHLATVSPVAEIVLSIRLLCESFFSCNWLHDLHCGHRILEHKMVVRGWCPSEVHRIVSGKKKGILLAYYLFRMRSDRRNQPAHKFCTRQVCKANNSALGGTQDDSATGNSAQMPLQHRTRHVYEGCTCSTIAVDTQELCEVIASGQIPLIELSDHKGTLELRVTWACPSDEYFAVSHMWADGLGNFLKRMACRNASCAVSGS